MDYHEALNYIHSCHTMGAKKEGLHHMSKLLHLLGNPHQKYPVIHVAGTNGKGSVCAYIDAILRETGLRVGLYTSPYLERFNERIRVNGQPALDDELGMLATNVKEKLDLMVAQGDTHPTEFEMITAMGFLCFAHQNVDVAVIEVGLGGRLDQTNVVDPMISVITTIDYDHTHVLGNRLQQIAIEKAGIIKPNSTVVMHPQDSEVKAVIQAVCKEKNAQLIDMEQVQIERTSYSLEGQCYRLQYEDDVFDDVHISLLGYHQVINSATSLIIALELRKKGFDISKDAILCGLSKAKWAGRTELIGKNPVILLDGAHNAQGAHALSCTIKEVLNDRRVILVVGMLAKKVNDLMISYFKKFADVVIVTAPNHKACLPAGGLAERFAGHSHVIAVPNAVEAVKKGLAMCSPNDALVVSGSLYLVGEVRSTLREMNG